MPTPSRRPHDIQPAYRFITRADPSTALQIMTLYQAAGWWSSTSDSLDLVTRIVQGSHCFLIARQASQIIGMGRAISDGASDAYIQDVTVQRSLRGRGIGRNLVKQLSQRLMADGIHWIGLIAENNTLNFYAPMGFRAMPGAHPMVKIVP